MKKNNQIEQRITNQLQTMSIREKIGQCIMIEPVFCLRELQEDGYPLTSLTDPAFLKILLEEYSIGTLLYGGITRIGTDHLLDWGSYIKAVNSYVREHKHIPLLYGIDAIHGVNFAKETTIFSHNLGAISTWNPELVKAYQTNVAKELDAIGINLNFAPTVDVARDQRWGRVYESVGEDPFLASVMSKAMVEGLQHNNSVAACAKHFVGYGASNNGMDRTPVDLSERQLRELYLPPFEAAIESGVQTIMVSGGDLNGVPLPASKRILTDLLRDDLGFRGATISDWEDVYRLENRHFVVPTQEDAILRAFNAGLDMNMAVSNLKTVDIMEKLVKDGKISMERLDQAAGNVLRVKHTIGLYEKQPINLTTIEARPYLEESKQLAKQVVIESLTLLKNDHFLLPIKPEVTSILVTGIGANSKRHLCGGWTLNWASANEEDLNFPTIFEALKQSVSTDIKITYAPSLEVLNNLNPSKNDFDICISVVTEEPHSEWLGDTFNLHFEEEEFTLLQAAQATGIPVAMVSVVGRPQQMMWVHEHIPAVLWAYLPGSEGAQPIVDVLLGNETPSGKLPMTFPVNANQIPVVYNRRRYISGEVETAYNPLYPFGYGLSYTTFEYSNLTAPDTVAQGEDIKLNLTVTNTGSFKGMETVQVYTVDRYASVTRPLKSLKAFAKVALEPGESKQVDLTIFAKDLMIYNEYLELVEEARDMHLHIGYMVHRISIT